MWKEPKIDFGVHAPGTKFIGHFEYDGELRLKEIRTTCGCTAAKVDGNKLRVTVNVGALIGASRRTKTKTITVIHKDNSVHELHIVYTVDTEYGRQVSNPPS